MEPPPEKFMTKRVVEWTYFMCLTCAFHVSCTSQLLVLYQSTGGFSSGRELAAQEIFHLSGQFNPGL
jgi:hypothetical protein